MSFLSVKAYQYLRGVFLSLSHVTLKKWRSEIDVKTGIYDAALDIIHEKCVQTNKISKKFLCSVMIDDMTIRKFIRWDGKKYNGFVTYSKHYFKILETMKRNLELLKP